MLDLRRLFCFGLLSASLQPSARPTGCACCLLSALHQLSAHPTVSARRPFDPRGLGAAGAVQVRGAYTFTMSDSGRLSCSKNDTAYHGRYFTPPCLETLAPHRTIASSSPHSPTAMRLSSALCRV